MSIKVQKSTMVRPAKETPRHLLWLSRIDMMIRPPYAHTNLVYIYQNTSLPSSPTFFNAEILKRALSAILVPFYPMAGRLALNEKNDRYEIDCNAQGVLFIEAKTTYKLVDFGDFKPSDELRRVTIPTCDYSKGLSTFPLLMVQFTRFECGGVCLGFAQHHHSADGTSFFRFINSFARLAKGLELDVMPVHDRATYLAPRHPPLVKFRHLEYEPSFPPVPPKGLSGEILKETTTSIFTLSRDQINALRLQIMSEEKLNYKLSTFEMLSGHVWRSVCKARGLPNDQDVKLYMHVNGRSKLSDPILPKGYFGNVVFFSTCIAKAGDLINSPLRYSSNMIHGALDKLKNSEYLRSAIDYLESHPNLNSLVRGPMTVTCPNLVINNWARMPMYEADFGWGVPKFASSGEVKGEGEVTINQSPQKHGSYSVTIKLFTSHMILFEKYLYNLPLLGKL